MCVQDNEDLDTILENRRIVGQNFPDDRSECSPERKQEVLSDQEYQGRKKRKDILVEGLRRVRVRSHAIFSQTILFNPYP